MDTFSPILTLYISSRGERKVPVDIIIGIRWCRIDSVDKGARLATRESAWWTICGLFESSKKNVLSRNKPPAQ
jgi:hypothetical protein